MKPWKQHKPHEAVRVGWRTLVKKTFELPNGEISEFTTKDALGSVSGAVIALTKDNQVVIAEQFRTGPEKVFQELPGGGMEPGEDPKNAILRELREETGYISSEVEYLGEVYKDAYTNTVWHFYLARNARLDGSPILDETEFISVKLISIEELIDNAMGGRMTDSEAVFLAYEQLRKIQKEKK